MKKALVIGIIILLLGISMTPLTQGSDIREFSPYHKEVNSILKLYGLNLESTMGEFKHLLNKLVIKRTFRNPSLIAELKNDIETLSYIFDQIGVKDKMTIKQALTLIKNNKGLFQDNGINLFCSIFVFGHPAYGYPWFRLFKVLYGNWGIVEAWGDNYVKIKSQIIGYQSCEDQMCRNTSGNFIGLITFTPPAIYYTYMLITPYVRVNGFFTLFSQSDVPFVKSDGN